MLHTHDTKLLAFPFAVQLFEMPLKEVNDKGVGNIEAADCAQDSLILMCDSCSVKSRL